MKVFYNGFGTQEATFKTASPVLPKRAVSLQSTGYVDFADEGTAFTGVVASYKNNVAAVLMRGFAEANYKGTAPTVGICKLSVTAMGQFTVDEENGKPYTVLGVDTTSNTFEFFI